MQSILQTAFSYFLEYLQHILPILHIEIKRKDGVQLKRISLAGGRETMGQEQLALRRDMDEVVRLLDNCRRRFDLVLEDELLEAAIYEENALMARYRYLLRIAKERGEEASKPIEGRKDGCLTPSILADF
jgi:hypothetical protein